MPYRNAIAFLLVITAALPAAAQVSVSMHSGIEVQMTARIEPGSLRIPSGVRAMHIGPLPSRRAGSQPKAVLCIRRDHRTKERLSGISGSH